MMIGNGIEEFALGNMKLSTIVCNMQEKIRPLRRHYYCACDAVIFAIDGNDRERLADAAQELHCMLNEKEFLNMQTEFPVLIFVTKYDLPNCMDIDEVREALHLEAFDRQGWRLGTKTGTFQFQLFPCCSTDGRGLREGWEWLASQLPEWRPGRNITNRLASFTTLL